MGNKSIETTPLDVSAQFYPIISGKKSQSLFRLTILLTDEVDKEALERAVNNALEDYPLYKVKLVRGYAWWMFAPNERPFKLWTKGEEMLSPILFEENGGYLFRVTAEGKEVHITMFHTLTDGQGLSLFAKAIMHRYAELKGIVLPPLETASFEEQEEYSFRGNYRRGEGDQGLGNLLGKKPVLLGGTLTGEKRGDKYDFETSALLSAAKREGVSFTALVLGVLAKTLSERAGGRSIVLMVPVNLRPIFGSRTMRNFVTFARITFDGKQRSIKEFAEDAAAQLKKKAEKSAMQGFINTAVMADRNFIMRIVPLRLKTFLINLGRKLFKSRQTMIISNLGRQDWGEGYEKLLSGFRFHLNVSDTAKVNLGIISNSGKTSFCFTRSIEEKDVEKSFLQNLEACI
jgi:NRPS condensation-like uncharacterized protein